MPIFRRRREPHVPEWASFMTAAEYGEFTATVSAEVSALGVEWMWADGSVVLHFDDGPYTMGLANLAQMVHAAEPGDRTQLVRSHFTRLIELRDDTSRESPAFDDVAPLLKLRVWAEADLPPDFPLVAKPIAEGLIAVLSIDWPEEVSTVHAEVADGWGRDRDELWRLAERNTRADPDVEVEVRAASGGDGLPVAMCIGDSFFSASRALWPDELVPGEPSTQDVLVAFPNRHLGIACPMTDARIVGVISWLAAFVHDRCVEGPGSISDDLYWWSGGAWTRLPVEVTGDKVEFFPPEPFVEVLNRLAE